MHNKLIIVVIVFITIISCSEDNDITVPRNLQEYINVNSGRSLANVIACAASANGNNASTFVYYYPETGSSEIRYYETDSVNVDENNLENYYRKELLPTAVFGDKLGRYTRSGSEEAWGIVTYLTDGKLHKSNPIRLKNASKPTEYSDAIVVDSTQVSMPKFTWQNGTYTDNVIFFQVMQKEDNTFLSGTYTTDFNFQYYNTSNVVLNITDGSPESLVDDENYKLTILGVSEDNWVNLHLENTFKSN